MSIAAELNKLACEVAAPPGSNATYLDVAGADVERPVASEEDALAIAAAVDQGESGFVAVAVGETGIDIYKNAAVAARVLKGRVPVRVHWGPLLSIKAAALSLLYGADELCGPLAPHEIQKKIAIIGGPPEDPSCPTVPHVEELIRACGRTPVRRPA